MDWQNFLDQIQKSMSGAAAPAPQPQPVPTPPPGPSMGGGLQGMSPVGTNAPYHGDPFQLNAPQQGTLAAFSPSQPQQGQPNPVVNPTGYQGDAARTMTNTQVSQGQNVPGYGQVQGGYDPAAGSVNMKGLAGPQVSPLATMHGSGAAGGGPLGLGGAPGAGGSNLKLDASGMPIGPPQQVSPQMVADTIRSLAPQLNQQDAMKYYGKVYEQLQNAFNAPYIAQVEKAQFNLKIKEAASKGEIADVKLLLAKEAAKHREEIDAARLKLQEAQGGRQGQALGLKREELDLKEGKKPGEKEEEPSSLYGYAKRALTGGGNKPRNEDATPEAGGTSSLEDWARQAIAQGANPAEVQKRLRELSGSAGEP